MDEKKYYKCKYIKWLNKSDLGSNVKIYSMIKSLTFVAVFVHLNLLYPTEGRLPTCAVGKHDA